MIPIRLEMKNFLPYRVPDPVRFEGIHLACLTGANGAGKSSILDAITWALWGKARTARDDDLIHLGQSDMSVQLDFVQEDVKYRVWRQRARAKKTGVSKLELFIYSDDEKFTLISEPSIKMTQSKINGILRLDYDTFIHSAFLQQGKADAFTTQTPAHRKNILSDILGLDQWSVFEDRAKQHLAKIQEEIRFCEREVHNIDKQLASKPALLANLKDVEAAHQEAERAWDQADKRRAELQYTSEALKRAKTAKSERERRLSEYQQDRDSTQTRIDNKHQKIAEYNELLDQQETIEHGHAALVTARESDETLSDKLTELRGISERRSDVASELRAIQSRLESEADNLRQRIADDETTIAASPDDALADVQTQVTVLQDKQAQREQLSQRDSDLKSEQSGLAERLKVLTEEGLTLRGRLEQLQDVETAVCPVCGQSLDTHQRETLVAELEHDVELRREEYRQCMERRGEIESELREGAATMRDLDRELKALPALIQRTGTLEAQVDAASEAASRLEDDRDKLAAIKIQLRDENFALDLRAQIAELDQEQQTLGYSEGEHAGVRQTLKEYQRYEEMKALLGVAQRGKPALEQELEDDQQRLKRLTDAIAETEAAIHFSEGEIIELGVLVEEFEKREAETRLLRTQEQEARNKLIAVQQKLNALDALVDKKAAYNVQLEGLRHHEGIYKELRDAFGKKGVPAMIIEAAIPELEAAANALLVRMTDGRMNLRFNTQREKVTGGMAETLDIEIADELGTRNYEMYSGGEAFRINFAVRVALSQMLARRAGAHLRTLFIDEGFGTQDDSGREKLVEAITAVQENFDLILVITHIDELRDSFPVHVVVDKTPNGSRVSVR